jgi:hypothetical protein
MKITNADRISNMEFLDIIVTPMDLSRAIQIPTSCQFYRSALTKLVKNECPLSHKQSLVSLTAEGLLSAAQPFTEIDQIRCRRRSP